MEKKDKKLKKKLEVWFNNIRKDRDYSAEQFDKLVVYLSSGALVLSVGFVKDIVQITDKTNTALLIISWSLFILSLLTMLLSHKTSIISMDNELNEKEKRSNNWDVVTEILNWSATIFLFTGIIIFIIFIYKHI